MNLASFTGQRSVGREGAAKKRLPFGGPCGEAPNGKRVLGSTSDQNEMVRLLLALVTALVVCLALGLEVAGAGLAVAAL